MVPIWEARCMNIIQGPGNGRGQIFMVLEKYMDTFTTSSMYHLIPTLVSHDHTFLEMDSC